MDVGKRAFTQQVFNGYDRLKSLQAPWNVTIALARMYLCFIMDFTVSVVDQVGMVDTNDPL